MRQAPASALIEHADSFECNCADYSKAFRADLVERVLRGVVEHVVVTVVEVDQVGRGYAALYEWHVVVGHSDFSTEEMRLISDPGCSLGDQVFQPGRGVRVALDVQVGIANHVFQEKSLCL